MVLALCPFSDDLLSMLQVSFNLLLHIERYAPDKLFIAKNKKKINSVNICDKVTTLVFCDFPHGFPSMYRVSFDYLNTFRDLLQTSLLMQN